MRLLGCRRAAEGAAMKGKVKKRAHKFCGVKSFSDLRAWLVRACGGDREQAVRKYLKRLWQVEGQKKHAGA